MAPRHSAADHSFDLGAWRPAWLILPGHGPVTCKSGDV